MALKIHESSFRDPSGFLFYEEGKLFRQVNKSYQEDYDLLLSSGLYDKLIEKGFLIPHREVDNHGGTRSKCCSSCSGIYLRGYNQEYR